jgi:tetratricopeptide (TPR) repeat protein
MHLRRLRARDLFPPAAEPCRIGTATSEALLISRKLTAAQGRLGVAFERKVGFSDALDAANEVLQLDPTNSEALTIRALADSQLNSFREAIQDAESAIVLDPNDRSPSGVRMRNELPVWRNRISLYGGERTWER